MSEDLAALPVPFGKHKGLTVAELLVADPNYIEWLTAQAWFAERFAKLHEAIITRGHGIDATPEHNAMQVRFLGLIYRAAFMLLVCRELVEDREGAKRALVRHLDRQKASLMEELRRLDWRLIPEGKNRDELRLVKRRELVELDEECRRSQGAVGWDYYSQVSFEQKGVDVIVSGGWHWGEHWVQTDRATADLKPALGDDFPGVLRQVQRLEVRNIIVGRYTGKGASLAQVRQFFRTDGRRIIMADEIEALLPAAEALPVWQE